MKRIALAAAAAIFLIHPAFAQRANYEQMVASHAAANGVPAELVHRVIVRESRYNPRAVSKGNYGMMQIKLATARGLGYTGTAQGLLDPETNLTYAVKYLAGAYRAANGNHIRAVSYYAGGYYYAAKRQGMLERQQAAIQQPASFLDANAEILPRHARRRHRHHH
ncbi:MAG TPA: transglycosylase SLT domain-containing protein [Afipia sp.]